MKLEDFKQAKHLQDRIEEFDKMEKAIWDAVKDVNGQHNENDAENLASLIIKLVETKEGENALDYIVGTIMLRLRDARKEIRKLFEEL